MSQDVEDVPLLVPEDLPAGWAMPDRPAIASSADSVAIDAAPELSVLGVIRR